MHQFLIHWIKFIWKHEILIYCLFYSSIYFFQQNNFLEWKESKTPNNLLCPFQVDLHGITKMSQIWQVSFLRNYWPTKNWLSFFKLEYELFKSRYFGKLRQKYLTLNEYKLSSTKRVLVLDYSKAIQNSFFVS